MRWFLIGIFALGAVNAVGQKDGTRPEPVGSITGHVTCADTQRPARLAQVRLVALSTAAASDDETNRLQTGGQVTQTNLDGSYTLKKVKAGEYLLTVDKDGYLSPLSDFRSEDLRSKDPGMQAKVARELRPVRVQAEQTIQQDIRLERGASVTGTVLYDDGTPASGLIVKILEHNAAGKWQARQPNGLDYIQPRTDDFGRYRMSGLPTGEYATEIDLILTDRESSTGPMPGRPDSIMTINYEKTRYSLGLFSGDKLRKNQAEAFTLGAGQDRTGVDLTFPLSKLHKVSGQLVSKSGQSINGGKVSLVYADDQTPLTETDVNFEEALFKLDFVPEGEFELKISSAKDLTKVMVENAKGFTPRFHEETKTLKEYGEAEQALIVKGDMSDVIAMVPESRRSAPAK